MFPDRGRGLEQGFWGAVVSTARKDTNAVRPGTVPVPGPRAHFALMPDQGPPSCAAVTGADCIVLYLIRILAMN